MKSKKTQYMTSMALFLAIEIILVVTPLGYIPIGPLNATTMHIPVIIAGIILGKKAGAELGFVFGLTSMIKATIQPGITSFCFSPFVTIGTISGNYKSLLIAFVPRILLGYLAGLIFEIMKNKGYENSGVLAGALVGALTNTVLVLLGIYVFFGNAYASSLNVAYSGLIGLLLGVVTTNGILEAILAAVVSLAVYKAMKPLLKNNENKTSFV
ncbi:ECF transporter S component [Coprobacillus sp. AM18-4LB-d2]|nr:ECF transporter S component [Coprobacillus sp. AM18-4LB-d2]